VKYEGDRLSPHSFSPPLTVAEDSGASGAATRLALGRPDSEAAAEHLADALVGKLEAREAVIGVVGLGYVGLPLALDCAQSGFRTIGIDLDEARVAAIREGRSFLSYIDDKALSDVRDSLEAYTGSTALAAADVVLICVPTPVTGNCAPDLGAVRAAARGARDNLRRGQLVVLVSTSFPGTTSSVVGAILEESGLRAGEDFLLAFAPEREDPGNTEFPARRVPRVVGSDAPQGLRAVEAFFAAIGTPTVAVSSSETAEAVKLLENTFRAVNIALVNELKIAFGRMGIDIWEVIRAAQTKPFGFMPFFPGPGVGGHCIAADPYYLVWRAREFHVSTRLTEMACDINRLMPDQVIYGLIEALDTVVGRGLRGARVLVVGVAYKRNIGDARDSPALRIMQLLEERGAEVCFEDPHVPVLPDIDGYAAFAGRCAVMPRSTDYADYDCVAIIADHDEIDYAAIAQHGRLIVDTRNAFQRRGLPLSKVVKL
jgi:UDP-N-acetyl-D-glucosamine dehydrogenase